MHILDIWLEELKIFAPSNLKALLFGIGRQLGQTFSFLFAQVWWISLPFLFSHLLFYGLLHVVQSPNAIEIFRVLIICLKAYYAFLAALITFPGVSGWTSHYIAARQSLVWPAVTPFALWIYMAPHVYKFFCLLVTCSVVMLVVKYVSLVLLLSIDWFASPFFIFFAFIIIDTYVRYGVRHALEHTMYMVYYTYPVCVLVFGILYGLDWVLEYGALMMGAYMPVLALAINPMAIIIPVAIVLYGAVYEWHMKLVDELVEVTD